MCKKINTVWIAVLTITIFFMGSCGKKDFDINSPNPNQPSSVPPNYVLSAALTSSANLVFGGNANFANGWMGYWATYGEQSPAVLSYNITSDLYTGNWDAAYVILENYKFIEDQSGTPDKAYFQAIAKIMKAFHFQRLVDLYNNVPYHDALIATNSFPEYDSAASIYQDLVVQLDSAAAIISTANVVLVDNPGSSDVMFQGNMDEWIKFAHTLKLKILMRETEMAGGPANITAHLSGLTTNDFLGAGEDAAVNPGYSNSSSAQQNPLWQNVGYGTDGSPTGGNFYTRANSYAVNFYNTTHDTIRMRLFYAPNESGIIKGRAFGSSDVGQGNSIISGIGSGLLQSAGMSAPILPAFESLFLQAEAVQRGYIPGDPADLFKQAVTESFHSLGIPDYQAAAQQLYSQPDDKVNIDASSNKINTIILQKWAALNGIDPLESYSDWRRLGIPSDLPVSVYPGTTATHIPFRLLYPTSEYHYNAAHVNAQGNINAFTSRIFWMP
ncbi:MAG TPA: SusD/RagB family nutrient-binding outer membrane lipoprotein [Puia sp.]|nr:SusD/RagB family nutrient-binding outer membrane lipoprotein [Puia sp.]